MDSVVEMLRVVEFTASVYTIQKELYVCSLLVISINCVVHHVKNYFLSKPHWIEVSLDCFFFYITKVTFLCGYPKIA